MKSVSDFIHTKYKHEKQSLSYVKQSERDKAAIRSELLLELYYDVKKLEDDASIRKIKEANNGHI